MAHIMPLDGDDVILHLCGLRQIELPLRAHVSSVASRVPYRDIVGDVTDGLRNVIGIVRLYFNLGDCPLRIFDRQVGTQIQFDGDDRVVIPRQINSGDDRPYLNAFILARWRERQRDTRRIDRDDIDPPCFIVHASRRDRARSRCVYRQCRNLARSVNGQARRRADVGLHAYFAVN